MNDNELDGPSVLWDSALAMAVARDKTPKQKQPRIPGLSAAARDLGCNRQHLSAVLHHHRISHRLTRRFAEWQAAQASSPNPA